VLDPGLTHLCVLFLGLSLIVFVCLLPKLAVAGVVEILLLELFGLFLHRLNLLRGETDVKLSLDLKQEGVTCINILPPKLLQLLNFQIFLIILLSKLIDGGSELPLVGDQLLLEILGDDQSAGLLRVVVSVELSDALDCSATDDVGDAIGGVVNLSHHELAVVLSHFGIEVARGAQEDITIE
jgi:hypothetical protein